MSEEKVTQEDKSASPEAASPATGGVTGIKAVLDKSLQSYDKLPMLEIIFEKFIRQLSTALRNLTSEAVDITISEISSLRFGSYFQTIKNPFSIVVFKAIEWENLGLLILENNMIFSFVDLLLGGKKNAAQTQETDESRILTSIEQGLARQISEIILNEFSTAFDQISPTTFSYERLELNPNFVNIARPGDAVIALRLKISIDEQIKKIELMLPYKTIEPVKEQMQQVFLGDKFGNDQEWGRMLLGAVNEVDLPLEAVIMNRVATVEEIVKLKIGDTIVMDHAHDKDITLRSGHIELFTGNIGKVDKKLAFNLKNIIAE
jgi:flagellar motor switch protein FliM